MPKFRLCLPHRLRRALAAHEPIGTDINHRRDGTAFVNSLVVVPVYDDTGVALYLGIQSSPDMPLALKGSLTVG